MNSFNHPGVFESVYKTHYKALCNLAYKMVGEQPAAEDIVQNLFVKLWGKREKIVADNIRSYLTKSVINASLNYLKSHRSGRLISLASIQGQADHSTEQQLQYSELQAQIDRAIKKLPAKCQVIFSLSRFEGMPSQEIADHLGVSKRTVDNQIGIALKKLREALKHYLVAGTVFLLVLWVLFQLIFI